MNEEKGYYIAVFIIFIILMLIPIILILTENTPPKTEKENCLEFKGRQTRYVPVECLKYFNN